MNKNQNEIENLLENEKKRLLEANPQRKLMISIYNELMNNENITDFQKSDIEVTNVHHLVERYGLEDEDEEVRINHIEQVTGEDVKELLKHDWFIMIDVEQNMFPNFFFDNGNTKKDILDFYFK